MRSPCPRSRLVAVIIATLLAVSCDEPATSDDLPPVDTAPPPSWVHEHLLARNPDLRASIDQVVVIELEAPEHDPADDTGPRGRDEIRFHLAEARTWTLCLSDLRGRPHLLELVSEVTGATALSLAAAAHCEGPGCPNPCRTVTLAAGPHTFRLSHARLLDPSTQPVDDHPTVFFVRLRRLADILGDHAAQALPAAPPSEALAVQVSSTGCVGCTFNGQTFTNTYVADADFTDAKFIGTHFQNAVFATSAPLQIVDRDGTHRTDPYLCRFRNADFTGAIFESSAFNGCDGTGAIFAQATLTATTFGGQLKDANLSGTSFKGATLRDGTVCGAAAFGGVKIATIHPGLTLADITVPYALFPLASWPYVAFQGARVLLPADVSGTSFDGLALGGVDWVLPTDNAGNPIHLNLSRTSWLGTQVTFADADLSFGNFTDADFRGADFSRADFTRANLTRARFADGTLPQAVFGGVTATYTDFENADLAGAVFDSAGTTSLYGARLAGADLSFAHLAHVDLTQANLAGSTTLLVGADLQGATLSGANLAWVDLTNVAGRGLSATGANFIGAILDGADLGRSSAGQPSNLSNGLFCGASLAGLLLHDAVLTGAWFPTVDQTVPGPGGAHVACHAVDVSVVSTTAETICPDGAHPDNGAACAGTDWQHVGPAPTYCCTPQIGQFCPPALRDGQPCTDPCDCASQKCATGFCVH